VSNFFPLWLDACSSSRRGPTVSKYESLEKSAGTIILSSHYDSRGSFGNSRAPGGDDNGRRFPSR
jgi:hypothetical protein